MWSVPQKPACGSDMKKKDTIVDFYVAWYPNMGGEHDLIYVLIEWNLTVRQIRNRFLKRNKNWKSKDMSLAKLII